MLHRITTRAALLAALLAAGAALGQATPEAAPEIGPDDWQVRCEDGGCVVVKRVPIDAEGRQLTLTFAVPTGDGAVRMALITPLGTALEDGLRLQVGTQQAVYRFVTCLSDGCLVIANLAADDVANMGVQPAMEATFSAVSRPEPYTVAIPLADFAEAIGVARNGGQP